MNLKYSFLVVILLATFALHGQNTGLLNVQKFTLTNGLTVYLNPDSTATRVFGAVQVNAGSIHESPEATGMSHYLEHMLFKGTDRIGTLNYEKEKDHYASIIELYDQLESTEGQKQRELIHQKINEQSIEAATYGLPNEFSTLLKSIGASELSAFADYDITFYHNYFPAHQMEKWLDINAQRFINPVFRTFQSELEVVYEEKNRYDDDFENAIYDAMQEMLYPDYTYGLWPVIGKTEHLKNPSLSKMHDFYNRYYVAKNMALILSGNFDPNETKVLITSTFSGLNDAGFETVDYGIPKPLSGIVKKEISVTPYPMAGICYPTVVTDHSDKAILDICQYLLSNSLKTGILDQYESSGKIKKIYSEYDEHGLATSYGIFFIPNDKQSIEDAKDIVIEGIEQLSSGQFEEDLITLAQLNIMKAFWLDLENLENRSLMIARSHYFNMDWEKYLNYPAEIKAVTKEQIIEVAKKYFSGNYGLLISTKGNPKKDNLKKPKLKPVITDQKAESPYSKSFKSIVTREIKPTILDFSEIESVQVSAGQMVYLIKNPVNDLFQLEFRFNTGFSDDPGLEEAIDLSKYLGAGELSSLELKKAFEAIGCSYSISVEENSTILLLEGIGKEIANSLKLLHLLLDDPKADDNAIKSLIKEYQTNRNNELQSPFTVGFALIRYGVFEDDTKFLKRTPISELQNREVSEITKKLQDLYQNTAVDIIYTGNLEKEKLLSVLNNELQLTKVQAKPKSSIKNIRTIDDNVIYIVNDKNVRQNQVYFYLQGDKYERSNYPLVKAFNTYYGESLTGIVYQEIREYRSLAYSTFARFIEPNNAGEKGYLVTGFGCQSDKTMEAISEMVKLVQAFPERDGRIDRLRSTMIQKINTDFPNFRDIGSVVVDLKSNGYDHDPNEEAFEVYKNMEMSDLASFYNQQFKDKPFVITIYGNKKYLNLKELSKYGQIVELEIDDIFVY